MPFIPYAIGAFMMLPFAIWAVLWMAFPGPKPGITDSPLTFALLAVSIPLVLFHYIAALGYIANSMAGRAGEELPVWGPARWTQRALAPLTVLLTLAAVIFVFDQGEGVLGAAAVGVAGLFMAAIMAVARRPRRSAAVMAAPGKALAPRHLRAEHADHQAARHRHALAGNRRQPGPRRPGDRHQHGAGSGADRRAVRL
jgi:hypothetical protein